MKFTLPLMLVGMMLLPPSSFAAEVFNRESLPRDPGSGAFPTDVWTFFCPAGGSVKIKVDAVELIGATTSPLDPVALLFFDTTSSQIASGDDEVACSATLDCSFQCVDITVNCSSAGRYSLFIFNGVLGGCGTAEGIYDLSVEVFDAANGTGSSLTAEQVNLGGEPVKRRLNGGGKLPAGPAADDIYWDGLSLPSSAPVAPLNDSQGNIGSSQSVRKPAFK